MCCKIKERGCVRRGWGKMMYSVLNEENTEVSQQWRKHISVSAMKKTQKCLNNEENVEQWIKCWSINNEWIVEEVDYGVDYIG